MAGAWIEKRASGLGYAMAAEYVKRGWNVVGTVRGGARTLLHDLADTSENRVEIETVDICEPDQIAALRARLSGRVFDVLFVNAGVTNNPSETIAEVTTEEFVRVMVTNALGPMRVVEALHDLVSPTGTIAMRGLGFGRGRGVAGCQKASLEGENHQARAVTRRQIA